MGLDISAYSGLQSVPDFGDDYPPGCVRLRANQAEFAARAGETKPGTYRVGGDLDFRAGSYGGYNRWRDNLAKLAGYESARYVWNNVPEGPFAELINFSDCEGYIGATVAAKLAADFAAHQSKVDALDDQFFRRTYADFRKAFELAANNGAVDFH